MTGPGYLGDYKAGSTLDFAFDSAVNGLPSTLSSITVKVYKGSSSTTEVTTGVTTTADFDALTGIVHVTIDLSNAFYAAGNDFIVTMTAGTLGGNTVRSVLATFSIENRCVNWAQVVSPTTSVGLSGTTIGTVSAVSDKTGYSLTQAFPSNFSALVIDSTGRVNAFLIGILTSVFTEGATGRIAAAFKQFFNVASPASTMEAITGVATATNLTNAPTAGDFTATMKTSLSAATPSVTVSDKTGFSLSSAGVQAIWDALTSALTTVGSVGKRIADFLTGDSYVRLGAPAGASHAADVAAVKTDTAAIKSKTDNLPSSPAAVSDIAALFTTAMVESYNVDGSAPTPAQALMVIMQRLTEFAISGTAITVKKLDGSTTAFTLTIDSATTPTSSTRSS